MKRCCKKDIYQLPVVSAHHTFGKKLSPEESGDARLGYINGYGHALVLGRVDFRRSN